MKSELMQQLNAQCLECRSCILGDTRTNTVFGVGSGIRRERSAERETGKVNIEIIRASGEIAVTVCKTALHRRLVKGQREAEAPRDPRAARIGNERIILFSEKDGAEKIDRIGRIAASVSVDVGRLIDRVETAEQDMPEKVVRVG